MLKLIKLDETKVFSPDGSIEVIGVSEWRHYDNGRRTDRLLGYAYICITGKKSFYEKIRIRVPDLPPLFKTEDVENAIDPIYVRFVGIKTKFYQTKDGLGVTITADKGEIVNHKSAAKNA